MKRSTGTNTTQSGGGDFTPEELALVARFRKLDDRAQQLVSRISTRYAADYPRYQRPALRLVVGGR